MATGQLIATINCVTEEITLDIVGGVASGDFEVIFPDGTAQSISGTLPLTVTSIFDGIHIFYNTILDSSSTVSQVLSTSVDFQKSGCNQEADLSFCLFNLNNAYHKAKCKNKKDAELEKIKLDRAIQLYALMQNNTECGFVVPYNQLEEYKNEFNEITNCNNCKELDSDIMGDFEVYGCTDPNFAEFNPLANIDDGSCSTPVVLGCTNPAATNYDPNANTDDGSCIFTVFGCTDPTASNYNSNATVDDGSCIYCVYGCTDNTAVNYDPNANCDDGTCITNVPGCTDPTATNFNPLATIDDGTCVYPGPSSCADNSTTNGLNTYINYDATATTDCNGDTLTVAGDASTGPQNAGFNDCCIPCVFGCTDPTALNYDPNATCNDGSCIAVVYGCTDPSAVNYFPGAQVDDGSCCFVVGCTDPTATNYDPNACFDNGSCLYCNVYGCTDPTATNYDANADCEDGSCVFGACSGTANIPDNNFEDYLEDNAMGDGTNSNNTVLKSNICNVLSINPSFNSYGTIESAVGLEHFADLEEVTFQNHNIKTTHGSIGTWNFNDNINLKSIWITQGSQSISTITLNLCTNLEYITLYDSNVQNNALDVTSNTNIKQINVGRTSVANIIGITNCTQLEYISFESVPSFNTQDFSFTDNLKGANFINTFNVGTITLSSTLDLRQLDPANGGWDFVTGTSNNNCTGTVKVGTGTVPGTSGGSGAGGLQTRVEYMQSTFPNSGSNKVTSTNITFTT